MSSRFKSSFVDSNIEKGRAEGRTEGRLEVGEPALLAILTSRGFTIGAQVRALIRSCTDAGLFVQWITRATTAATIEAVFAGSAMPQAPTRTFQLSPVVADLP